MEKEELDLCPEMTEWGSRDTKFVDPDGCVAEWRVESLGWGHEWSPLPALMAKPSNFAWQVSVADVVVGLGRSKRKCLSGYQVFSGLFLRMTWKMRKHKMWAKKFRTPERLSHWHMSEFPFCKRRQCKYDKWAWETVNFRCSPCFSLAEVGFYVHGPLPEFLKETWNQCVTCSFLLIRRTPDGSSLAPDPIGYQMSVWLYKRTEGLEVETWIPFLTHH